MRETPATYHVSTVAAPPMATIPVVIDPRLRALLLVMRRAAFMVGDAIGEYLGMPKRGAIDTPG